MLAYHRVLDINPDEFPFDGDLISATTDNFRRQMRFVRSNFNVISFRDLAECERENRPWPERAVLITFDDGYRDNYTQAFPILKELGLPATCFLVTGHVGRANLPWWDMIAYSFLHTPRGAVTLPEVSTLPMQLNTRGQRRDAVRRTLSWVKLVPEEAKSDFLSRLPGVLDVAPQDEVERMHLSWEEAREMARHGIEFGGHTVTHPILSRVCETRLVDEVRRSKRDIEERLGTPAYAFAYPVGDESSYGEAARRAVALAGFRYAVSYRNGTTTAGGFDRYALPRIHVEAAVSDNLFRACLLFPGLMLREFPRLTLPGR
jgi:peptidoglycan/xylan/chitin deacetylase (PgdA/CDA1 family)